MDWRSSKAAGRAKDKPDIEIIFEEEIALAHLLINEVIFLNSFWSKSPKHDPESGWSEEESKYTCLYVLCNDVFAWGCADAEDLPYDELRNLYEMWLKDPSWGPAVWCIKQRNSMPQKPVEDHINAAGIWDLKSLSLAPNTLDAEITAIFTGKSA